MCGNLEYQLVSNQHRSLKRNLGMCIIMMLLLVAIQKTSNQYNNRHLIEVTLMLHIGKPVTLKCKMVK